MSSGQGVTGEGIQELTSKQLNINYYIIEIEGHTDSEI